MTVQEKRDILVELKKHYDWDNYDELYLKSIDSCLNELISDNYVLNRFKDILSRVAISKTIKKTHTEVEGLDFRMDEVEEWSVKVATDFDIAAFKELLNQIGYDLVKKSEDCE